jgi:TRAP-type C4-dicarboxylate transport system permease small subunit
VSSADTRSLADKAERLGRVTETALLTVLLGAMVLLAATQIALRNFWDTGFGWADETLRILVLWVTVVGSVAATRDQRHVRIDALSRYLPVPVRNWSGIAMDAFAAVVCGVLAWSSYGLVADALAADDRVLGGELPAWPIQLILPVGFALMCYRYAVGCLRPRSTPRAGPAAH